MNNEPKLNSLRLVANFMAEELTDRHKDGMVIFNDTILADKPTFEGKVTSEGEIVVIINSENMINLADIGKKITRYPIDVTWDIELMLEEVTLEDANQLIDMVIQELEAETMRAKGKLHMFKESVRPQTEEEKDITDQLGKLEDLKAEKVAEDIEKNPFSSVSTRIYAEKPPEVNPLDVARRVVDIMTKGLK